MADRTVTYKMKLVPDEGNSASAAKFAKQSLDAQAKAASAAQKEATRLHEMGVKERIKLEQQAVREIDRIRKDASKADSQTRATQAAREGTKTRVALIRDEWVRVRELSTAYRELGSAISSLPKNRIPGAASVRTARAVTPGSPDLMGPMPLSDQERKAREREAAAAERARQRDAREAFRERVKYMRDEERKIKDIERAEGDLNRKRAESKRAVLEAGEGLLKMGRGFAAIGLLSEESNEKLLRGLVLVQGTFDLVSGGVKAWVAVNDALKAYRATLVAVSALESARSAAGAAGALSGTAGAVGGIGAMGTLGSIAGMSLLGLAGMGLAVGGIGLYGSDPTRSQGMARTALGFGESFFGEGLLRTTRDLTPSGLPLSQASAAILQERKQGMQLYQAFTTDPNQRYVRDRATISGGRLGANMQMRDNEMAIATSESQRLVASEARRADILQEIETYQKEITDASDDSVTAQLRLNDLQGALIGQAQEELGIREQIRKSAIDASRERIRGMETELSKIRDLQEREQDRYTSAAERFAQMTAEEQRQVIAAKDKAAREGVTALTRREADLLRGTGLESLQKLASQRDVQAAEAAGFGSLIGAEERQAIADRTKQIMNMQVDLNKEIDVKAKLEASPDEFAAKIVAQLLPQFTAFRNETQRLVQEQLDEEFRLSERQQNARKAAELRAGGNR